SGMGRTGEAGRSHLRCEGVLRHQSRGRESRTRPDRGLDHDVTDLSGTVGAALGPARRLRAGGDARRRAPRLADRRRSPRLNHCDLDPGLTRVRPHSGPASVGPASLGSGVGGSRQIVRSSALMASTPDSEQVDDEVEQLLLNPEDNLEAITESADLFKALATPSRLKMLLVLTHGEATVTHIVDSTGLSQPLVSQHLKFLRGLHLV